MLHDFLFSPFANPAAGRQYQQLQAALRADQTAPVSLLLGNFAVEEGGAAIDAVVVRPHSITVFLFVPRGGKLQIPALQYGAWQLEGQPLPGVTADTDNPYEQFRQQKEALTAWLEPQFSPGQVNLQHISGVAMFAAPVTFGPDVEEQLSQQPDGSFQLLADAGQLQRRLAQLAAPDIDLSEAELTQWAQELREQDKEPDATTATPAPSVSMAAPIADKTAEKSDGTSSFLNKAWSWLGAADIPEDVPYGHPAAQAAASTAEKQRLEQLQREAQAQVQQQLQAMEAREAERERSILELRTQLAQAPPVAHEAQALRDQLAAESQEKAALEEAIRASRAESESRNRELDTKIDQLSQLITQLNERAAAPAPAPEALRAAPASKAAPASVAPLPASTPVSSAPFAPPIAAFSATPAAAPPVVTPNIPNAGPTAAAPAGFRRVIGWRRRLPRVGAMAALAAVLGLGVWGISRLSADPPKPYQENGKWGLADASGEPVVPAKYASVAPLQQERAVVEDKGAFGVIDAEGKEIILPAYDALNSYAEGYARVRVDDAYTFVDAEGQEFADYYFNAQDFSEGYAAVLDHRGWHYISGPEPEDPAKPPVLFREAYSFREGLARVRLADGYTYIKKGYLSDPSKGTEPFGRYELATDFEKGQARVIQKGRSFLIDTDGDEVD